MGEELIQSKMPVGKSEEEGKGAATANREQLLNFAIQDLQLIKFQLEKLLPLLSRHLGVEDAKKIRQIEELSQTYKIKKLNPDDIECPKCKQKAGWEHLVNAPYGMSGAYMSGSERYVCKGCGYKVYGDNNIGLDFLYD